MKRIFISFIIVLMLCCGCSAADSSVKAVSREISFTAQITHNTQIFEYYVEIDKAGNTCMKHISKNSSPDMELYFNEDEVTFKYNDLEYSTDVESLPTNSILNFIPAVFEEIYKNRENIRFKNDEFFITATAGEYNFTAFFGETGLPLRIKDGSRDLCAIIKNATVIVDK